jgi:hypothetical protein
MKYFFLFLPATEMASKEYIDDSVFISNEPHIKNVIFWDVLPHGSCKG